MFYSLSVFFCTKCLLSADWVWARSVWVCNVCLLPLAVKDGIQIIKKIWVRRLAIYVGPEAEPQAGEGGWQGPLTRCQEKEVWRVRGDIPICTNSLHVKNESLCNKQILWLRRKDPTLPDKHLCKWFLHAMSDWTQNAVGFWEPRGPCVCRVPVFFFCIFDESHWFAKLELCDVTGSRNILSCFDN